MSFNMFSNFIIMICALGILVMFLRRIPEVAEEKGHGFRPAAIALDNADLTARSSREIWQNFSKFISRIIDAIWHFMLEAKDLKEGRILASNLTKIVAGNTKRVINIGAFNQLRRAEKQIASGDLDGAELTYFQILKKHPHEYPAYEGLIRIYTKQKKQDELIETLQYLTAHNPSNHSYYAQLGKALLQNRQYPEAAEAYDKSLELNNLIPARFANAGLAYQGSGNLAEARKYYQKAVDLEPSNMQYLTMLVDCLERLNQRQEALTLLKNAQEIDPENTLLQDRIIKLES